MPTELTAEPTPTTAPSSFGIQSRDALPVIIVAAGVASAISGQQPTGNVLADFVLSFALGAGVVWISRFASPEALVLSAGLALFFSGLQTPALFIGIVAVASAFFITSWKRFDHESWMIGAAVSALFTSQAALNLPSIRFVGSASILAAVALAPILVTGYRNLPTVFRRRIRWIAGALFCYCVIATAMTGVAALGVRDYVEVGIEQAEDGVSAVQAGNQPEAVELLDAAERNFDRGSKRLAGPLTWPARFVPIVAQHARALETAADQGGALAGTASRIVTRADVEAIRGQNGQIDLELVQDVNLELTQANFTLADARDALLAVRSPWLLPLLSTRLESVQEELVDTAEDIDLANQATAVLPKIMGAEGPRRYLVLFVQPAESREYGGFVGAYGILDAADGGFSLAESGSIDKDLGRGTIAFSEPGMFPESYVFLAPNFNPQNLTGIADLTTVAAAAQDFIPQLREDPTFTIDGVITLDPYALAGILELTGPIALDGLEDPITSANVVDFLLRDQYTAFGDEREERQDLLKVLAGEAFDRMLSIEIPGPERLGAVFGPIARANRLGFVTFDDDENAFLSRIFLSADMPRGDENIDMLGVYTATARASKLDAYTYRSTHYTVEVDPATGNVTGHVELSMANNAPPEASAYVLGIDESNGLDGTLLEPGHNLLALSVYAPQEISSVGATDAIEYRGATPALGYERSWAVLEVPLGDTVTVEFDTTAVVAPGRYDLAVPASQSANPVEFTLTVRPIPGWRVLADDVAADGSWTRTVATDSGNLFTLLFGRDE